MRDKELEAILEAIHSKKEPKEETKLARCIFYWSVVSSCFVGFCAFITANVHFIKIGVKAALDAWLEQ